MSDVVSLARRVDKVEASPQFTDYSKVVIHVDEETVIEVGNDTGRTLEFTNPFATQQMAQDILAKLTGFQYQPYTATDALLDPAAEIGDAASMRGAYGGIYKRERKYDENMPANIAAPHDEEINHEYAFETPQERKFTRQINDVKASLIIANDRIDASVSQTGGEQATFGWSLTSNAHKWYANGQEVMAVTASGLSVKGKVEATSGKIGGFTISASAIYNNISSMSGTQSSGVYIGTDGIKLGQRFKVTSSGAVSADSMTLTGTLTIGGTNITAAALRSGAQSAYSNSSYWSGASNTVNSNASSWTTGANRAGNYYSATQSSSGRAPKYYVTTLDALGLYLNGSIISKTSQTIGGTTIKYLSW